MSNKPVFLVERIGYRIALYSEGDSWACRWVLLALVMRAGKVRQQWQGGGIAGDVDRAIKQADSAIEQCESDYMARFEGKYGKLPSNAPASQDMPAMASRNTADDTAPGEGIDRAASVESQPRLFAYEYGGER